MTRRFPMVALDLDDVRSVVPGATSIEPLAGGAVNTNLRVCTPSDTLVLKVHADTGRDPADEREAMALVDDLCVPAVLGQGVICGRPYTLLEWVDGERFDVAMTAFDNRDWTSVFQDIAQFLAALRTRTWRTRFEHDYTTYATSAFAHARVQSALGEACEPLLARALSIAPRLDAANTGALTHSDFRADNLLVRRVDGRFRLAAVLDWEFAHGGCPMWDLATLTRRHADYPPFVLDILERELELPADWFDWVRTMDLANLVDKLIGFPEGSPVWIFARDQCQKVFSSSAMQATQAGDSGRAFNRA